MLLDSDDPMEHMSDLECSSDNDSSAGDDDDTEQTPDKDPDSPQYSVFLKSSLKRKKLHPDEARQQMKVGL